MISKRRIAGAALAGAAAVAAAVGGTTAGQANTTATHAGTTAAKADSTNTPLMKVTKAAANPSCPSGVPYIIAWDPSGDKVFLRDCKADGWGARVYVNRIPPNNANLVYTGLTLHDPSAGGDGSWKGMSSIPEHQFISVHAYSYRGNSKKNQYYSMNCSSPRRTYGFCY